MISASPKHRIFLAIEPIDFRKGLDSIARLCKNQLQQNPDNGHYFLFRNKRRTDIKLLYYDSQGFCLFQKRLSASKFNHWPSSPHSLVTLTPAQFQVLLYNGDPQNTQEEAAWRSLQEPP